MSSREEHRGEKRPAEDSSLHSANSWETADLGDDQRRQKFLRLMGAGKKEHHGRFQIGDHNPVHSRSGNEEKNMEKELQNQYEHSLAEKLSGRTKRHVGLGFVEEEPEISDKKEEKQGDKKEDEDKQEKKEDGKRKEDGGEKTNKSDEKEEKTKEKDIEKKCDSSDKVSEKKPEED
ncbi:small acidic protein-like [Glandiceps talaboti]